MSLRAKLAAILLGTLCACRPEPVATCTKDSFCFRDAGLGRCLPTTVGAFCAFVDDGCASDLRWDRTADPSLANSCVLNAAAVCTTASCGASSDGGYPAVDGGPAGLDAQNCESPNYTDPSTGVDYCCPTGATSVAQCTLHGWGNCCP